MGRDLKDEAASLEVLDLKGIKDRWEVVGLELDVDDGTNDSLDGSGRRLGLRSVGAGD